MPTRAHTWRVAALLFGSGACALVYQVAWLRELRAIFGASTAASAAVLAIFVGGLGLGSLIFGPRADRHPRPLLFYSRLESVVAVSVAASPFLVVAARGLYLALGGSTTLGAAGATLGRLLLSALVLGVPTVAMGGTLPAAARSATARADVGRRDTAALYALNTLGAVAGCLLSTFYLLEVFGTQATLWLAAGVNLLVAVLARQLDRSVPPAAADAPAPDAVHGAGAHAGFVTLSAGLVGFVFFLMELVWYRMLGPLLGGSVFTFGLILAVALAGIGAGGLAYAVSARGRRATMTGFALSCLLEAVAMAGAFALGDRLALVALILKPFAVAGFAGQVLAWTIVTSIAVLPAALVAGYQFPLLIALLGEGRERVGAQIGRAYAANTLGAIAGSLAGGFGLLPWLSAPGAWRLAAGSLAALGAAAAIVAARDGARRPLLPLAGLAAATVALLAALGPTAVWRHAGIGAGRTGLDVFDSANQLRAFVHTQRRAPAWEGDGVESSVALVAADSGYAFIVNGKSDGSARVDAGTQVMLGLLGAMLHPDARRSLVIGLGTGSSAGWLGAVPSMERVDVVELEPLVVDVARACAAVNRNVLDNPKVHVTIGDARETLLTTDARYDVIASEPSNPFRAGVASLFTREYYDAARRRLNPGGVFVQWVQAYEIDAGTLRTIYATMAAAFPHVETWQGNVGDLMLVGTDGPLAYRAADLSARIRQEPFAAALAVAWRAVDLTGVLAHFIGGDALARDLGGGDVAVNTDDRNVVEFGFARSVGESTWLVEEVRAHARAIGAGRPALDDPQAVDWPRVDTAWVGYQAMAGRTVGIAGDAPAAERARQTALLLYYGAGNHAAARDAWTQQGGPPRDPTELVMVAHLAAETGSNEALPFIDALRTFEPGEADTLLGELHLRQGRLADAAASLEAAFVRFRTDPWPLLIVKRRALALAEDLARRDPALAPRMADALGQPLAVDELHDDRVIALAEMARLVDFGGTCRAAVAPLEPDVPWTEAFLTLRRDCYAATGDARLSAAERDLRRFLANAR